MSLFKILVAAATVATALAAPHEHKKPHPSYGDANAQCGNHQKLSCCNRGDSGGVLDGLLGGNCQPINILGESDHEYATVWRSTNMTKQLCSPSRTSAPTRLPAALETPT